MRYAVAQQQGFDEEQVLAVDDEFRSADLSPRVIAALCLADWFAGLPAPPPPEDRARIRAELTEQEVAGLLFSLVQARAFAKNRMALGLEPEPGTMPTRTV